MDRPVADFRFGPHPFVRDSRKSTHPGVRPGAQDDGVAYPRHCVLHDCDLRAHAIAIILLLSVYHVEAEVHVNAVIDIYMYIVYYTGLRRGRKLSELESCMFPGRRRPFIIDLYLIRCETNVFRYIENTSTYSEFIFYIYT